MSYRTESNRQEDRADHAGPEPICRRLFTVHQAAAFASVPVGSIGRWIATGELETYRLEGGTRIDKVELKNFLNYR